MKRILCLLMSVVVLCFVCGCASYVDIDNNKGTGQDKPNDEVQITGDNNGEEPITPDVIQKLSSDEAKSKVQKLYGGKGVVIKLEGEYKVNDAIYFVFDLGADMGGMFSKDFSVVVDAQSGEMYEGTYDKVNKKIVRY